MKIEAKITNIMLNDSNVKAIASVNLDGCFAVRNIRVMSGKNGLFISMPSVKDQDNYIDICFPITPEFRTQLHQTVVDAYHQSIAQLQGQNQGQSRSNAGYAAPPQTANQYDPSMPEYPGEAYGYPPAPAMTM